MKRLSKMKRLSIKEIKQNKNLFICLTNKRNSKKKHKIRICEINNINNTKNIIGYININQYKKLTTKPYLFEFDKYFNSYIYLEIIRGD